MGSERESDREVFEGAETVVWTVWILSLGECYDFVFMTTLIFVMTWRGWAQVLAEFTQLVPETNKLHEALLKIFKRKVLSGSLSLSLSLSLSVLFFLCTISDDLRAQSE
jgi:glycopeptide antibiotics resistance protein